MAKGRHYDRARVAAAKVSGSISHLAAAERELAAEIVKRLDDGTSIDDLAEFLSLPTTAVHALVELHGTRWRAGEPEPLPVTPAALAAVREATLLGSPPIE